MFQAVASPINGILPSSARIIANTYPIGRTIYHVTLKRDADCVKTAGACDFVGEPRADDPGDRWQRLERHRRYGRSLRCHPRVHAVHVPWFGSPARSECRTPGSTTSRRSRRGSTTRASPWSPPPCGPAAHAARSCRSGLLDDVERGRPRGRPLSGYRKGSPMAGRGQVRVVIVAAVAAVAMLLTIARPRRLSPRRSCNRRRKSSPRSMPPASRSRSRSLRAVSGRVRSSTSSSATALR